MSFLIFNLKNIYLFTCHWTGSLSLHLGFLELWFMGGTLEINAVCGLLIAVASLVDHGLKNSGSVVHGLSCARECGIFLDPCPLHWQADS